MKPLRDLLTVRSTTLSTSSKMRLVLCVVTGADTPDTRFLADGGCRGSRGGLLEGGGLLDIGGMKRGRRDRLYISISLSESISSSDEAEPGVCVLCLLR